MAKKELKVDELNKVNGGDSLYTYVTCKKCNKEFNLDFSESRQVGSGCDKHYEHKCPHCDHWDSY